MFPRRFFAGRFFAPRFFPVGGSTPPPPSGSTLLVNVRFIVNIGTLMNRG